MNRYTSETLAQIDWDKMLELLSKFSHFAITANTILHNYQDRSQQEILDTFNKTQQWLDCIRNDENTLISIFANISPQSHLSQISLSISKGSIPSLLELHLIASCCENYLSSFDHLPPYHTSEVELSKIQKSVLPFIKKIRLLINKNGDASYENLPEVKKAQDKIIALEKNIREVIQKVMTNPETNKSLQYNNYDIIYDRYVLPIKSDSYNYQLGTIVARSETGKTLYVEPIDLKILANTRLELLNKIDEIINTYCLHAFQLISDHIQVFCQILLSLDHFDEYLTRAKFAHALGLSKPNIVKNKEIKLFNFFHPLISQPIKNHLVLSEEQVGMLISGPNMGGKTATLKAICLILFMAKNGLFVPAQEAHLFLFEDIFYFSDDLQNITNGQSSFSGEVNKYLAALATFSQSKLFIFDEIFNTTSSEEASALAFSLFKEIDAQGGKILASTHHQTLKTLVHQDKSFISAHVSFDNNNNQPTYRLITGVPGSSYALNIFTKIMQNFDLSSHLLKRAQHLLDNKMLHYEALLNSLNQKQVELDHQIQAVKLQKKEIENLKEAERGILQLQRDKNFQKLRHEIDTIKENYIHKIKHQNNEKIIEKVTQEIIAEISPPSQQSVLLNESLYRNIESKIKINEFVVGKTYFSEILNCDVVISKIDYKKKRAFVNKGNVSVFVPLASLNKSKNKSSANIKSSITIAETSYILDARGMRLIEFEIETDRLIAQLYNDSFPYIEIIHGHGDGILKNWLHQLIKKNPDLSFIDDESGNQGVTRIKLT
jgi:DNA mismatch repair protein MutS2